MHSKRLAREDHHEFTLDEIFVARPVRQCQRNRVNS